MKELKKNLVSSVRTEAYELRLPLLCLLIADLLIYLIVPLILTESVLLST